MATKQKPTVKSARFVSDVGANSRVVGEPVLVITENDLDADVRNALAAARTGGRLLGGESTLVSIYDELPGAIARRLKRITPSDFRVAKITLRLQLDINIPGLKMGGTVDVTLEPSSAQGAVRT